jgi:membrane protein implicated in regulation of membrane protease activity
MFALIALICFILALFHVNLGSIDLAVLGFVFIALHLLFDIRPWAGRWRGTP